MRTIETTATRSPRIALLVLCTGLFLVSLDVTVMNVALPSLRADLRPSPQGLLWVADGYALALACGLLAAGAWSDAHGRRRAFALGLTLCGATSVCGALATGTAQVVVARLGMGCGAALLMPSTLSLIAVLFPVPAARRRAIAIWTLVAGLGAVAGPVVGGALVEWFSWRAGFWVNVPVVVCALAGTWRWVPESRQPRAHPADRVGMLAVTLGVLALVWAIIEVPALGWTDPGVLTGFLAAAVVLAFLFGWEKRHPSPVLPPGLLGDRRFTAAACALGWMFFSLTGALLILTLYLQTVLGYPPVQTGLHLLPLAGASGAGAGLSLLLAPRWGDKLPVTAGMALVAGGFLFLALAPDGSGYGPVLGFQLVTGFGSGLAGAPATEAVMGAVPGERAGTGAAVNDLVREIGSALGIATIGSLLTAGAYRNGLLLDRISESLPPSPSAAQQEQARDAFSATFSTGLHAASWAAAAAALVGALLAASWLPHRATDSTADQPGSTQPQESEFR